MGISLLVLSVLMLTGYAHYRSTYMGRTDWPLFWGREAMIGVLIVFVIAQFLRKAPTRSKPGSEPGDIHDK